MKNEYVKISPEDREKIDKFIQKEIAEGNLDTSFAKVREEIKNLKETD